MSSSRNISTKMFSGFLGARIVGSAMSLLTVIVITRDVPVAVVGAYSAAMAVVFLLALFLDLGSTQLLVREVEQRGEITSPVHDFVRARVLLTTLTTVLGIVLVVSTLPSDARDAGLVAMIAVAFSFSGALVGFGQVTDSIAEYRNAVIIQSAVTLVSTVLLVLTKPDPSAALLIGCVALGAFVASIYTFTVLHRAVGLPRLGGGVSGLSSWMRSLAVIGFATAIGSVYLRVDAVMLVRIAGPEAAAFYAIATRVLDQARLVPTALMVPLGPFLSRRLSGGGALSREDRATVGAISIFGGIALATMMIATSDLAIAVLGGPKYEASVDLLIILAFAVSLSGFVISTTLFTIMSGLERRLLGMAAIALVFNIGLNLLLIPEHGATAAAAVTAATEVIVFVGLLLMTDRAHAGRALMLATATLACTAVAAAAKALAIDSGLAINILVSVALAVLAFLAARKAMAAIARIDREP